MSTDEQQPEPAKVYCRVKLAEAMDATEHRPPQNEGEHLAKRPKPRRGKNRGEDNQQRDSNSNHFRSV
jgi:hypothetical protein